MDFVKKAVGSHNESSSSNNNAGSNQNQLGQQSQHNQKNQQNQQDYVDKAFNFAAKKSGYNIDRNTEEKITDAGRNAYEKATGKKVSEKISN